MFPLAGVCRLLPRSAELTREVALATAEPAAYVARFKKRLSLRGVDEPVPELPWIALVDGLIAQRAAAEIDWREEPESWLPQLRKLVPAAARAKLPTGKELDALSPADNAALLKVVGDSLAGSKLALAFIDLRSDSYPLTVVPAGTAAKLVTAARAAKGKIAILRGANLAALRRAHEKEERAWAAQVARRQREAKAGGPAWRELMEAHGSFSMAVFSLQHDDDDDVALFVRAAAAAPPARRAAAQERAELLSAPVAAARKRDPMRLLGLMPKLPQTCAQVRGRVQALAVIARRIPLGLEDAATTAFLRASNIYRQFRDEAREAARPADLARWARLAEARLLDRRDGNAIDALFWMGDEETFARLAPRTPTPRRDQEPSPRQDLVDFLAKAYKKRWHRTWW